MSTMKTFISSFLCLSSLFLTNQIEAKHPPYHADMLIVNLNNTGSEHCYLVDQNIFSGKLLSNNIVPDVLYATGVNQQFIIAGNVSTITLKYNCGNDKTFSINMHHFWDKHNLEKRRLKVTFDATDVFETHTQKLGWRKSWNCNPNPTSGGLYCYYGVPTTIDWSITH